MADSEAVQYSRLLRPFSTRRLDEALYHVEATAGSITSRKQKLLVDTPTTAAEWRFELAELRNELDTLAEYCGDARRKLEALDRSAEGDYARAIDAMTKMLRGIAAEGQAA